MFVKLYSRITESSLMEQPVEVRYTFLMLLAIADPTGRVVGTDVAIARRLNVPVDDFVKSVKILGEPDADSNSKEEEGRRILPSDGERGYQLVNFLKYRNLKDEDEKREYMREYMRKRRAAKPGVKNGKTELNELAKVTQAEAEAEAEAEQKTSAPGAVRGRGKDFDGIEEQAEVATALELEVKNGTPLSAEPEKKGRFHADFIEAWCSEFQAYRSEKYDVCGGKDGAAVKRLGATGRKVDELIATARAAWARKTAPNWHCQKAVSIAYFAGFLNEIRAELAANPQSPKRADPNFGAIGDVLTSKKMAY